jgi:hypothetical protein
MRIVQRVQRPSQTDRGNKPLIQVRKKIEAERVDWLKKDLIGMIGVAVALPIASDE